MTEQGTIVWVTFTFWREARTRKAILRNFSSDTRLRFAPISKVTFTYLQRTLTWLNDWTAGVHDRIGRKNDKILYEIILLSATFTVDIPNQSEEKEKMLCQCRENLSTSCTFQFHLPKKTQFLGSGHHCTMCSLGSMFSFQPNKLRHILKVASW